jgi:hypothetical protein
METVAEAIDHSAFVISCISDAYKRDNHCQSEIEYAFHSKRFILPLIVRKESTIDGWLSPIMNRNFAVDIGTVDFKTASSLLMKEINQHYKTRLSYVKSRGITPVNGQQILPSSTSFINDRQSPVHPYPRPTTPASTPTIIYRQEQIANRSNSRPTTPGMVPSLIKTLPTNVAIGQGQLSDEYAKRNTSDSRYRSMPTNTWKKDDVLDFLYDTNLYAMMPLCESMGGEAFIRLFQMCQAKPSRLYDRLNEELHSRFKGSFLPMGTYTQFLIEMDGLLGPALATYPALLPPPPKITNRLGNIGQLQPSPVQPSPIPSMYSTASAHSMQTMTPTEGIQGSGTRVVERAVFRPASIVGRPYNFVVESVQESTALLRQVERYGTQLLLLDEKAQQHRVMNGSH